MMISVIVPVYKVEPYLNRCIDSVINQTLTDFELILTDDGSPDACGGVCDEYAVNDERLVVIHQQNGGLSAARNSGIDWSFACSDSEWISFIDSDDYVNRCYLQYLFYAVQTTKTNISICDFACEDKLDSEKQENIQIRSQDFVIKKSVDDAWLDPTIHTISAWGYLYKKELFKQVRYPVGRIHEDSFTTYKLVFHCLDIACVRLELYYYNNLAFSITRSPWNPRRMDNLDACKQLLQYFNDNGNYTVYMYELRGYLNSLAFNVIQSGDEKKYKKIHHELQDELRSQIKQNKDSLKLKISNDPIYVAAYPVRTRVYCMLCGVCKRIKHFFRMK